jgi:hypothetical protein
MHATRPIVIPLKLVGKDRSFTATPQLADFTSGIPE